MPSYISGGRIGQISATTAQIQITVGTRMLHNDNALSNIQERNLLVRILSPILRVCRAAHYSTSSIQNINIIVVGGMSQGVSPEQINAPYAASRLHCIVGSTAKIMDAPAPAYSRRTPVLEIAFPGPGGAATEPPWVSP